MVQHHELPSLLVNGLTASFSLTNPLENDLVRLVTEVNQSFNYVVRSLLESSTVGEFIIAVGVRPETFETLTCGYQVDLLFSKVHLLVEGQVCVVDFGLVADFAGFDGFGGDLAEEFLGHRLVEVRGESLFVRSLFDTVKFVVAIGVRPENVRTRL